MERKKGRIDALAPLLAQVFTPLFLVVLVALLVTMAVTGTAPAADRGLLIWFDLLLALVMGMTLYGLSARDPEAPPGPWDVLVLALVAAALVVDVVALSGVVGRLAEYGVTANRVAALGANLLLLVNLLMLAVGYVCLLGEGRFLGIVRMQMRYLPIYAGWAALVVVAFPPLFGYR